MKALIFAAGEGKRMQPYTFEKPKPMIELLGKPLLHHLFDSLPDSIDEVILVVGYKAEQIKDYFGVVFNGRRIHYVQQDRATGTAHALFLARPYLTRGENFLALYADDLHDKKAMEKSLTYDRSLLVKYEEKPEKFGVVSIDKDKKVLELEEKPEKPKSNLVSIGVYVLDEKIFQYQPQMHKGEYYMATMIGDMLKDHPIYAVESDFWIPIGYPEDLKKAEEILTKGVTQKAMMNKVEEKV